MAGVPVPLNAYDSAVADLQIRCKVDEATAKMFYNLCMQDFDVAQSLLDANPVMVSNNTVAQTNKNYQDLIKFASPAKLSKLAALKLLQIAGWSLDMAKANYKLKNKTIAPAPPSSSSSTSATQAMANSTISNSSSNSKSYSSQSKTTSKRTYGFLPLGKSSSSSSTPTSSFFKSTPKTPAPTKKSPKVSPPQKKQNTSSSPENVTTTATSSSSSGSSSTNNNPGPSTRQTKLGDLGISSLNFNYEKQVARDAGNLKTEDFLIKYTRGKSQIEISKMMKVLPLAAKRYLIFHIPSGEDLIEILLGLNSSELITRFLFNVYLEIVVGKIFSMLYDPIIKNQNLNEEQKQEEFDKVSERLFPFINLIPCSAPLIVLQQFLRAARIYKGAQVPIVNGGNLQFNLELQLKYNLTQEQGDAVEDSRKKAIEAVNNTEDKECSYCGRRFTLVKDRRSHERSQHEFDFDFECDLPNCKDNIKGIRHGFCHSGNWKKHINSVQNKRDVKCPYCIYSTNNSSVMDIHINSGHFGQLCYVCDCFYSCYHLGHMKSHVRANVGHKYEQIPKDDHRRVGKKPQDKGEVKVTVHLDKGKKQFSPAPPSDHACSNWILQVEKLELEPENGNRIEFEPTKGLDLSKPLSGIYMKISNAPGESNVKYIGQVSNRNILVRWDDHMSYCNTTNLSNYGTSGSFHFRKFLQKSDPLYNDKDTNEDMKFCTPGCNKNCFKECSKFKNQRFILLWGIQPPQDLSEKEQTKWLNDRKQLVSDKEKEFIKLFGAYAPENRGGLNLNRGG